MAACLQCGEKLRDCTCLPVFSLGTKEARKQRAEIWEEGYRAGQKEMRDRAAKWADGLGNSWLDPMMTAEAIRKLPVHNGHETNGGG